MAADFAAPDAKSLWQDQAPDADPVTLDQVHALVRGYDRRARRKGATLALMLVVIGALGAVSWIHRHDPITAVLFVGGELTAWYLVWRLIFPPRDPAEPAVAYLRRRMQLRLAHAQGGWVWALLPLLPVILRLSYLTLQRHQAPALGRATPFIIFVAALGFAAIRAGRRARQVKAELKALDALLKG